MPSLRDTELWNDFEEFFGPNIQSINHVGVSFDCPAEIDYQITLSEGEVSFTTTKGAGFYTVNGLDGLNFVEPLLFKDVVYVNPVEFHRWNLEWGNA